MQGEHAYPASYHLQKRGRKINRDGQYLKEVTCIDKSRKRAGL